MVEPIVVIASEWPGKSLSDVSPAGAFHAIAGLLGIATRHVDALGVTHEPDAAAIADRVLQLREGRLVTESGPAGEPFASPRPLP